MEVWKDIKGYEGLYQVSSLGNVKSLDYQGYSREKMLKIGKTSKIYNIATLYKNGKSKKFKVNRLVYFTFNTGDINYYNPYEKTLVCHISEVLINGRLNDSLENLFLGTHKDNMDDMAKKGRGFTKGKFGALHNNSKRINQYTLDGELVKIWGGLREVHRELGICSAGISRCCKFKRKTAGGFIWKYSKLELQEPRSKDTLN